MEIESGSSPGIPFVVAIPVENDDDVGTLRGVFLQQKKADGFGGAKRKLRRREYFFLTAKMLPSEVHRRVRDSKMPLKELKATFNDETLGKFIVQFDGADADEMEFAWRRLISKPMEAIFFGAPTTQNRFYSRLFRDTVDLEYCFKIYRQFTLELWGDAKECAKLNDAFQSKRVELIKSASLGAEKTARELLKRRSFAGKVNTKFFDKVDNLFKTEMEGCKESFNNYSLPLVSKAQLQPLMAECRELFHVEWVAKETFEEYRASREASSSVQIQDERTDVPLPEWRSRVIQRRKDANFKSKILTE